jgi:hypothetical protein
MLAEQDGPAILVAHSHGGVVITESGTDPLEGRLAAERRSRSGTR